MSVAQVLLFPLLLQISQISQKLVSMVMTSAQHLLLLAPRWHNHRILRLTKGKWHILGNLANSGPDADQTFMSLDSQVSTQTFYHGLGLPLTLSSNSSDTKRTALSLIVHFHAGEAFELGSWCEINCSAMEEGTLSASQP